MGKLRRNMRLEVWRNTGTLFARLTAGTIGKYRCKAVKEDKTQGMTNPSQKSLFLNKLGILPLLVCTIATGSWAKGKESRSRSTHSLRRMETAQMVTK